MNDQQDSLNAYRERRITERARVAKLVLVALVAGFVGAGWGYVKGEVAVLTGDSEVASVLLAVNTTGTGAAGTQSGVAPTKPGDVKAPTKEQKQQDCLSGKDPQCVNRCSPTFVSVDETSGDVKVVKDCSEDNKDKANELLKELEKCIKDNKGAAIEHKTLKTKLCEVASPAKAQFAENADSRVNVTNPNGGISGGVKASDAAQGSSKQGTVNDKDSAPLQIPNKCRDAYDKVIAIRGQGQQKTSTGIDCSLGPVVCYKKTGSSDEYDCKQKPKDSQKGGDTTKKDDSEKSVLEKLKKCIEDAGGGLAVALKCGSQVFGGGGSGAGGGGAGGSGATNGVTGGGSPLGNALGRALGQGLTGQSGSGNNNQQQPQCPAGYTLSNQQPQTNTRTGQTTGYDEYGAYTQPVVYTNNTYVCVPSNQANAQPPQCTFNVSKKNPTKGEKVTLTWSTSNTDNGGKVMLSDGTNSGKIETSGTQDVTISSPRTYTLTAYNAKGETKECKVEITLGGTGEEGTSGAYPPKLSCAPSIIEAGKSATVTWECPTAAKKSAGEGTTTGGAVKGQKTVTPTTNSEYTVSCFSSDTANIDDEESEDFLGKRTCSVRVAKPEFDIIAYPEQAKRGERVRISWGSLFMKTCKVSGPRGFDYTRPNGVVVTEPFSTNEQTAPDRTIRAAVYTITCESLFGKTYSADTEVDFQN